MKFRSVTEILGSLKPLDRRVIEIVSPSGEIVWRSNEGPQTEIFYRTEREILFGGARGGGKSQGLIVWMISGDEFAPQNSLQRHGYINHPKYKGAIFRRNATDLEDFIDEARQIYAHFGGKLAGKPPYFQFPTGARIYLNHLEDDSAFEKYKGWNLVRIGIEELTLIPRRALYLKLLGSCRSLAAPELRAQILSTTNPDGAGAFWVKQRFVEVFSRDGKKKVPWGTTMRDPVGNTRVFIPAKVKDNPYIGNDPSYIPTLMAQEEHIRRAWLDGDWNAMSGKFFTEFRPVKREGEADEALHVIPSGSVGLQPYWHRWMGGDYGYSHFSAFYKFCQRPNGQVYVYDELVQRRVGAFELGTMVAKWCIPDLEFQPGNQMTLYFSPEQFYRKDAVRSVAEQFQAGVNYVLGPNACFLANYTPEEQVVRQSDPEAAALALRSRMSEQAPFAAIVVRQANTDRVGGAQYIRELMRWNKVLIQMEPDLAYAKKLAEEKGIYEYERYMDLFRNRKEEVLPKLQIFGEKCPRLISCLENLVHDTRPGKNPEDVMKVDADPTSDSQAGDDEYDGFRYGAMAHKEIHNNQPKEFWMGERMDRAREKYANDPAMLAQIAAYQNAKWENQHRAPAGMNFARAGSTRWRN